MTIIPKGTIIGDSEEYDLLAQWVRELKLSDPLPDRILTCEIGVRKGMGSKIILDEIIKRLPKIGLRTSFKHVGVDPYDDLLYQHYDHTLPKRKDYDAKMMKQMVQNFRFYHQYKYLHMTDTEFMGAWYDHKVPFDFVHLDGPHMTKDVLTEAVWFANRSRVGSRMVFDDFTLYGMDEIAHALTYFGYRTKHMGDFKCLLERDE